MHWPVAWVATAVIPSLACLAGCITVGPDYEPPVPNVPDHWHQQLTAGLSEGKSNLHTWWTTLKDPVLEGLIQRAALKNKDLELAFSRINEARAIRGIASGERYPDVNGVGSLQRQRLSEGIYGVVIPPLSRTDNIGVTGVDASWEIDLWGRITRSIESADASLGASVENYRDVLVLLFADVAVNYVDVRTLQARIQYAEQNVASQRGTLSLTKDRLEAKIAPELDVRQAELNLASTESLIPYLRQRLARAVHRLGVLLGEHPNALYEVLAAPAAIPRPPEQVSLGIPAEMVRQRPDLRRAERSLAAQTARIGVATAQLYPQFSLTGFFAYEGSNDLFDSGNRAWSFGPSLRWNLFDGGRVRNAIRVEDARTDAALVTYEQAVLRALEEVENGLVSYVEEGKRRADLARSVSAAERSVELVKTLYRAGLTNFQNVLDTERSLFNQQDALAESEGFVVKNLIHLYRALGGGWNPDPNPDPDAETHDKLRRGKPTN